MSSSNPAEPTDVVSNYFAPGKRSARELARSIPAATRPSKPSTARSRISAAKGGRSGKKARTLPMDPTPERLAKGDMVKTAGLHLSIPPVQRLRDQGKLDDHGSTNEAMFQAAEKFYRHFIGCGVGVKAQDLNKIVCSVGDELVGEEGWVHHRDQFVTACKLMGWSESNPKRGAGRIVVAVVCEESTVHDAALIHVGSANTTAMMGAAMDRLREGLFALALHWRFI